MARVMKNSGVAWIGEIPEEWMLGRVKNRYSHHKCIAGIRADDYERLALTLNGVVKRPKDDSTGLQPEAFNSYQILQPNELVFKLIDLANVATSRVGYSPYLGLVSPAYIILEPRNKWESRYGVYFFLSMWQREIFNHIGDDGVRSSLNASDLLNVPYLLMPAEEQSRIVAYLDRHCAEIDSVIAATQQTIEEYKKLKQSIITEAVTHGMRKPRKMKDSGVEWIGEIPEEWDIVRIKYLLQERNERSLNGEEEPLSMSQKYGLIPTRYMEMIPNLAASYVGAKLVHEKDLVFNKLKAHLGVFSVSNYHGLVSPDYAVYYSTGRANLKYLEYIFKTPQCIAEFRKKSTGIAAGLTRLYTDGLFSIMLPYPSLEEQQEITEQITHKCTEIDRLIEAKQQLLGQLEAYKKSVIYEYVTGKKEA